MPVYLSQTAYDQLHELLDYLEANWSSNVCDNYLNKLERTMEVISSMTYSFPAADKFPACENASSPAIPLHITELTRCGKRWKFWR